MVGEVAYDVVVVGTGHAGAQAAITLRLMKFDGTIAMLGEEPELPYERPPLSKDYLSGKRSFERTLIRPAAFWRDQGIDIMTREQVVAVEPEAHRIRTASKGQLAYKQLIWAAGGRPRRLNCPGHDLRGVHTVRNRADVDQIAAELGSSSQIVVIGGGYIGLEAAAVLSGMGKAVTLIETLPRVLSRVAGEALSRFFESEHAARGVTLLLSQGVDRLEGNDGRVSAVRLRDGRSLPAQIVIVGIGIVPATEPLQACGAEGDNGVRVDRQCRTSLPDIFAIGDCAAHTNQYADGATVRLESVQNANDQAIVVAKAIVGVDAGYDAVPWFWSSQYDLKLQTVGLSVGHDAAVVRGDPQTRSFSIIYLRRGRVVALDCINRPRDYVDGRLLVSAGQEVHPSLLADVSAPLRNLVKAANH